MTKRERKYIQQRSFPQLFRKAARAYSEAFHRALEASKPRPKFPLGSNIEKELAMIGDFSGRLPLPPAAAISLASYLKSPQL